MYLSLYNTPIENLDFSLNFSISASHYDNKETGTTIKLFPHFKGNFNFMIFD